MNTLFERRHKLFSLNINNNNNEIYIDLNKKGYKGYFIAKKIWFNSRPYRKIDEFTVLGYYVNEKKEKIKNKTLKVILKEKIFLSEKTNPRYILTSIWLDWDLR